MSTGKDGLSAEVRVSTGNDGMSAAGGRMYTGKVGLSAGGRVVSTGKAGLSAGGRGCLQGKLVCLERVSTVHHHILHHPNITHHQHNI